MLRQNGIDTSLFNAVPHHPYCQYDAKPTCRDEPFPRDFLQTADTNTRQAATLATRFLRQLAAAIGQLGKRK